MSTRCVPRQTPRRQVPLIEPPVIEGDCPTCKDPFVLNEHGQVPEHQRPDRWPTRRCPTSGWLARNPRPRRYFFVEGVQWR